MIYPKLKLVQVHIEKTGGSSIEWLLGYDNFTMNQKKYLDIRHLTLKQIHEMFPESKEYTSFTVVRNTWERLVSLYVQGRHDNSYGGRSFKEFLDIPTTKGWKDLSTEYERAAKPQTDYFDDSIDYILRFDNLKEDLRRMFKELNINIDVDKLPHERHSVPEYNRDYKSWYDEESRRKVEKKFAKEIEMFGWQFDKLK